MLKSFLSQCVRVWHLLKKPSRKEFLTTAKISAIGVSLVGLMGFVISIIINFFNY